MKKYFITTQTLAPGDILVEEDGFIRKVNKEEAIDFWKSLNQTTHE